MQKQIGFFQQTRKKFYEFLFLDESLSVVFQKHMRIHNFFSLWKGGKRYFLLKLVNLLLQKIRSDDLVTNQHTCRSIDHQEIIAKSRTKKLISPKN